MRLWNLPSWVDPKKALQTLNRAAVDGGVALAVKERARELGRKPLSSVLLPGFHLFEGPCPVAPYSWLLPKPKGDVQDLLGLWEAYVDQDLGARYSRRSPLEAIQRDRFVLGSAAFKRVFGGPRHPRDWAQPAAMIIALAQHLEGQENLQFTLSNAALMHERTLQLRMHLSGYMLEVSHRGIFSNMHRKVVSPRYQASDAKLEGLCIRPLRSAHPLAVALMENEDTPHACLQAANVVLRAVRQGLLDEQDVRLSAGAAPRAAREEAVVAALQLLDREKNLRLVYDKVVPRVVSAAEFRNLFGNPFRGVSAPRADTVDKWRAHLYSLVP